ncbi:MAG: DUF4238 domain-containing protein [Pseudomonadota bacterium]
MPKTRDNHYVPKWYQTGFVHERENELCHLRRNVFSLSNGETKTVDSIKWQTPTQRFYKKDLYTTFFGVNINDEIEQKLFGYIDDNGSSAVRAFLTDDQGEWHRHFQELFDYLDAQKLRTPKGLDWIKDKYPALNQNELMLEMQCLRTLHCILWTEGVRELVSADDSDVKFIISDHPITIYNYACPPESELCNYPEDPDISLKGSQTIFPLDKNRCLILTNLEYAQDPEGANPLEQRTNANKTRQSMVNTIEFINARKLTADDVTKINHIIKSRAKESVAAGSEQWLYPENNIECDWKELRHALLPPSNELHRYGGEMYAKFDDGHVHYQDAFGRTSRQHDFLNKNIDEKNLGRNDYCGCGSGKKYKKCCKGIPDDVRTTWLVASIRERNLALCNAINDILGLNNDKSWDDVRRDLSDEQIAKIYSFYAALWPSNTDIYSMLPKPDDKFRGLYTGTLDARTIGNCAFGMAPLFDEFLIQHPFVNPNNVKPEFSPVESPRKYKYQALKDFYLMLSLEPYIGTGLINLIPDPCCFDSNLHREMLDMATARKGTVISKDDQKLHLKLAMQDLLYSSYMMPRDMKTRMLLEEFPHINEEEAEEINKDLDDQVQTNPLIPLHKIFIGKGEQLMLFSMVPNYEMSLLLAQATGSVIVTDSETRWIEFQLAQHREQGIASYPWNGIYNKIKLILLDNEAADTYKKSRNSIYVKLRAFLKSTNNLVISNDQDIEKISQLNIQAREIMEKIKDSKINGDSIREFNVLAPSGGLYDKNVHRLLLKSNCLQYLKKVTSVYYIK